MDAVRHTLLVTIDAMEAAIRTERIRREGLEDSKAELVIIYEGGGPRPVMRARDLQDYLAVLGEDWSLASIYAQLNGLIVSGYIVAQDWPGGFTRTKLPCPPK